MVDGCGDSSSATVECADGAFLGNEQPGVCTCSEKHTPHIRINSDAPPCAPESANGRSVNPDDLISADVGWLVDGQFHPQVTLNCASCGVHRCEFCASVDNCVSRHQILRVPLDAPCCTWFRDRTERQDSLQTFIQTRPARHE